MERRIIAGRYEEYDPKIVVLKRYSRRKNDRFPLNTVVETERKKGVTYTLAYNISKTGMQLETRVPMDIGEIIVLNFALPNNNLEIISVKAKVINKTEELEERREIVGVEFLEVEDEGNLMDEFLEYNMIVEWLK